MSRNGDRLYDRLAAGLKKLSQLVSFTFNAIDAKDYGLVPSVDAVVAVIQSISQCSKLEHLDLDVIPYSEAIDDGLTACVHNCSQLEAFLLTVRGAATTTARGSRALFEAVKNSKTLTHVCFKRYIGLYSFANNWKLEDFWDADKEKSIQISVRLNEAGRGYLAVDAADKVEAIQVLANVSDDLDCLHTHLCENQVVVGCSSAGKRKRDASVGNEDADSTGSRKMSRRE
jgi:hypothetical protein